MVANGLLDRRRHIPKTNQFCSDFREVTPDAGLFHLGERRPEICGFDEGGLRQFGSRLIEDLVADISQ